MINLTSLDYNKPVLLNENLFQRIYIEKTFYSELSSDQYFIRIYGKNQRGDFIRQGYMYFAAYLLEKTSCFIGIYINPEFRNNGLSSLLLSFWLQICFDNNLYNIETISNQRKPFIVYLLKRYAFDLNDQSDYLNLNSNIYICKDSCNSQDRSKYLSFQNPDQEADFLSSAVFRNDDYRILSSLSEQYPILDTVILRKPYYLQDESKAYSISKAKTEQFESQ